MNNKEEIVLTKTEMLNMIKGLAEFPFGKICKHLVALQLLSIMEEKGIVMNLELIKAVSDSDDHRTLELIQKEFAD